LAYVGPFLRNNLGVVERVEMRILGADVTFKPDLTLFQVCRIDPSDQRAYPVGGGGSGDAAKLLGGDGVLVLGRGVTSYKKGGAFAFITFNQSN